MKDIVDLNSQARCDAEPLNTVHISEFDLKLHMMKVFDVPFYVSKQWEAGSKEERLA